MVACDELKSAASGVKNEAPASETSVLPVKYKCKYWYIRTLLEVVSVVLSMVRALNEYTVLPAYMF